MASYCWGLLNVLLVSDHYIHSTSMYVTSSVASSMVLSCEANGVIGGKEECAEVYVQVRSV